LFHASQNKKKSLWILGDIYTSKISGDETHGIYSIWEIEVPPNNGPPLHKHSMEDEAFYVLEGIFSFPYRDKEAKVLEKGQFIHCPRGEFHTYKNIGSSFGKLLLIINPPYFEKFFEEIGIPIEDKSSFEPSQVTPSMIENVVKTSTRYGLEIKT
jgi:quercetin dioxygenase-like cupin family protein